MPGVRGSRSGGMQFLISELINNLLASAPADERHLGCHDGYEQNVGVRRKVSNIGDNVAAMIRIHHRLGHDFPVRLWYAMLHVSAQWGIGIAGQSPASLGVRVVKTDLGNVPSRQYNNPDTKTPGISRPMTLYWKTEKNRAPQALSYE